MDYTVEHVVQRMTISLYTKKFIAVYPSEKLVFTQLIKTRDRQLELCLYVVQCVNAGVVHTSLQEALQYTTYP